jgi:acyl carrier protein
MSEAPSNSTEEIVGKIWINVLKLPTICREDIFFDLGGDSLAVIDMLHSLNRELKVELNPGLIFRDPSLKGFCKLVDQYLAQSSADDSR